MAGLAAEAPEMVGFSRIVIDGPLPRGERVNLLLAGWAGLCGNPREILAGPSRARDIRLFAIADSIRAPHARDLLTLARRQWAAPTGGGLVTSLANRGPAAIARRLLACTSTQ
jgi:hypothetical protein